MCLLVVVNLGGVADIPSNYTTFINLGGRGLDCAWDYDKAVQTRLGAAIKASSVDRSPTPSNTPALRISGICRLPKRGAGGPLSTREPRWSSHYHASDPAGAVPLLFRGGSRR